MARPRSRPARADPATIQQPPMHAQLLRKGDDVVALLQPLNGVPAGTPLETCPHVSWPLATPSWCQVCQFAVSQSRGSVQAYAYVRSIRPPEALRFVGGSTGPRQKVPRHLGDCRLIFQVLIEVNCAGRKDEG